MIEEELIGMEKQAALDLCASKGVKCRVESEDGQSFMVTMDYRMDRINLHITAGKVTSVTRG